MTTESLGARSSAEGAAEERSRNPLLKPRVLPSKREGLPGGPFAREQERALASKADLPPTQTINPIDTPPDSDRPTAAMLKADVDSGATGDKTEFFDPGMAMLGTCEEAAGTPLKPEQIALARRYETFQRWMKGSRKAGAAHHKTDGFPVAFVGFIALLAVVFVGAIAMT